MTIEIARSKATYIYRQNPFNPRCIDKRENKSGARWKHHSHYDSTMAAIEALMAITIEPYGKESSK